MNRSWQALRRLRTLTLTGALIAALAGINCGALAADIGVTIQTTKSPSYKGTAALTPAITGQLKGGSVNSDDPREIGKALGQLKDGDVLVLAIHSSPQVFAVGTTVPKWADFWKTFSISKPPRLAAVIIGGCMAVDIGAETFIPITPDQVRDLRQLFNAEIIYTPRGNIPYVLALNNTNGILTSLLSGKELGEIKLDGKWYQSVSARWVTSQWDKRTLKDLRDVDRTSRAYEAGLDVAAGRRKMADTYPEFKDDELTAQQFKLGFQRGRQEEHDKVNAEYDALRRKLEGR